MILSVAMDNLRRVLLRRLRLYAVLADRSIQIDPQLPPPQALGSSEAN